MSQKILLIDDDGPSLMILKNVLTAYDTTLASNGLQAVKLIEKGAEFDVIVSDLRMPKINGLELLDFVRQQQPFTEFILVTAHSSVDFAVRALKTGAFDYIEKPINLSKLSVSVERAMASARLKKVPIQEKGGDSRERTRETLVCESKAMWETSLLIEKAVRSSHANILIDGETGSGKNFVARTIHDMSCLKKEPFVSMKCASLSAARRKPDSSNQAMEDANCETASIERTFRSAKNGTLVLDELGLLPIEAQGELLGLLNESEETTPKGPGNPACRVISTTSQNLSRLVENGEFRKDLYYRLNGLSIIVPPLQNRIEDIEEIAYAFINNCGMRSRIERISSDALASLKSHDWPGNVRELRNCIETAVSFSNGPELTRNELSLPKKPAPEAGSEWKDRFENPDMDYQQALEIGRDAAAKLYLERLIQETSGNVSKAAKLAGIERPSMHRILKRYGINPNKERHARKG